MKDFDQITFEEKLGQLLVIGFKGLNLTDDIKEMIKKYKFGNFILYSRNYHTLEQFEKLVRDLHDEVIKSIGIMPFICIDQEGGRVTRITHKSTVYPGPMTLSATDNYSNVQTIGHMMGKHLMALGINVNLAPILDININPKNPVIGIRSFSDNVDVVSKYGIELIKDMQEEGIIATAKHFPGHGDTENDSHLGIPILPFDQKRIYNIELKPFKDAIKNGVDNIMTGHIIFQEIDKDNPATTSERIIRKLIRDEFKYQGLITADCMEMKGISEGISTPIGVVKAIKAGNDLVLVCNTKSKQIDSLNKIKQFIEDNLIAIDEIDDRVKRILKYKNKVYSIMKEKYFKNQNNLQIFKDDQEKIFIKSIVDSSLTFISGKNLELKGKILLYWCHELFVNIAGEDLTFGDLLNKEITTITSKEYNIDEYSIELIKISHDFDTVIFLSFNACLNNNQIKMINEIKSICSNFFVISINNPYDYLCLKGDINFYTMYEPTLNSMKTIIKFLKGEIEPKGHLPIKLKNIDI